MNLKKQKEKEHDYVIIIMMMIKGKFEREEAEIYVGGQEVILWNIIRGGMSIYWVAHNQLIVQTRPDFG